MPMMWKIKLVCFLLIFHDKIAKIAQCCKITLAAQHPRHAVPLAVLLIMGYRLDNKMPRCQLSSARLKCIECFHSRDQ